jgi:hypothetical protein
MRLLFLMGMINGCSPDMLHILIRVISQVIHDCHFIYNRVSIAVTSIFRIHILLLLVVVGY